MNCKGVVHVFVGGVGVGGRGGEGRRGGAGIDGEEIGVLAERMRTSNINPST